MRLIYTMHGFIRLYIVFLLVLPMIVTAQEPEAVLITNASQIPKGYLLDNVTTTQNGTVYATFIKEPSFADKLMTNPFLWIVIIIVLIIIVVIKLKPKQKSDPATKPFWGVEVREKMTDKVVKKRLNVFGEKIKFKFYKGYGNVIGIAVRKEAIYKRKTKGKYIPLNDDEIKEKIKSKSRKGISEEQLHRDYMEIKEAIEGGNQYIIRQYGKKQFTEEEISYWFLAIRSPGFVGWLMWLLMKKCEKMLIDPEALTIDESKKRMFLDPNAWIHDHSGVWTLGTKKENTLIDELNLQKDIENVKGYTADYLRRLSHENPGQSIFNERLSHEAELKEKAKQGRMTSVIGK